MDLNVKAFIEQAERAAAPRWPEVRMPAIRSRNIGIPGKKIFWPTMGYLLPRCLAYADLHGKEQKTLHLRHPAIADCIDPDAAIEAEMDCRNFIERVEQELAMLKKVDPNYIALAEEADAMIVAGILDRKTADVLGDRLPLAPCVFLVERLTGRTWPGKQIRRLVDALMDGWVTTPATVEVDMSYGGMPGAVTIVLFNGLRILFRLWEHGWNSDAPAMLVVEDEEVRGWDDTTRAIAAFCLSPSDAMAFKHAVTTILEILEEQP